MEWLTGSKLEQDYDKGCILSPSLFNLCAECIMWNTGLDNSRAGIKTARSNINNLRYADDKTLMAESEEELRSLLMRVKEQREKAGLKFNVKKNWRFHGQDLIGVKLCEFNINPKFTDVCMSHNTHTTTLNHNTCNTTKNRNTTLKARVGRGSFQVV